MNEAKYIVSWWPSLHVTCLCSVAFQLTPMATTWGRESSFWQVNEVEGGGLYWFVSVCRYKLEMDCCYTIAPHRSGPERTLRGDLPLNRTSCNALVHPFCETPVTNASCFFFCPILFLSLPYRYRSLEHTSNKSSACKFLSQSRFPREPELKRSVGKMG